MTMRVTIMGHAGLFLESGDARLLLDPILHDAPLASGAVEHLHPRALDLQRMPRPTAVVITHGHLDHFDPPSLDRLSRRTPVFIPEDTVLLGKVRALGFERVEVLASWRRHEIDGVGLTVTPSEAEIDEFGVLFETASERFWHMSDAEASEAIGRRIGGDRGVELASLKYQPTAQVQGQIFRNLGASFDKHEVVEWLETAAAARPRAAFPYASGIRFTGRFAWNNRYAFPLLEREVVRLMAERLPGAQVASVRAGDVYGLAGPEVRLERAASSFVRSTPGPTPEWEPLEDGALAGLEDPADRAELAARIRGLLPALLRRWIQLGRRGPLACFLEYGVVYQLTVHLGGGERLVYSVDFGAPRRQLRYGPHPGADYLAHVAGRSLLEVLRGQAGAELFHAGGDLRIHERILKVRQGRLWIPPHQGWELYNRLPEPLTWYLRHPERFSLAA